MMGLPTETLEDVAGIAAVSIVALMMGVGFVGVERSISRNDA